MVVVKGTQEVLVLTQVLPVVPVLSEVTTLVAQTVWAVLPPQPLP